MNQILRNLTLGGLFLALCMLAVLPRQAEAQERKVMVRKTPKDSTKVEAKRTATEVEAVEVKNGEIYVNGKLVKGEISEADGVRVIRIEDEGGQKEMVVRIAPGAPHAMRRGMEGAPGERRVIKRRIAPGHGDMDFEFDMDVDGPDDVLRWRMRDGMKGMLGEMPHMMMMRAHMEGNAEVARMEREAHELALKARGATGAERTRLEQELKAQLDKIFEKKMDVRREHAERMERELNEVRAQLSAREKARAEMIDRRLKELLGAEDALKW